MNYGRLPVTGAATLSIGGLLINETRLIAIAIIAVAVGAGLVRLAWRYKKNLVAR